MKKTLPFLILAISFISVFAQNQEEEPTNTIPLEIRKQMFIYGKSKDFRDPMITKMALYNLIADNPTNATLYDSLALLYFNLNENVSAAIVAEQAVSMNFNNVFATTIAASAFEKVGAREKALSYYEKIFLNDRSAFVLYKIALLQMELKRYVASNTSIDTILKDESTQEVGIFFPTADKKGQQISLYLAAYRLKAMIDEATGNIERAKSRYNEILKFQPDFEIVIDQLNRLNNATQATE